MLKVKILKMNKNITIVLRYILDELLPPFIRNSKFFMYPLFFLWYKGKNVSKLMDFKKTFHLLNEKEFEKYYEIHSAPQRITDISSAVGKFIFEKLNGDNPKKIIDVGCGNGYLLKGLQKKGFSNLTGFDIIERDFKAYDISFVKGNIESLPFQDKEFDVVICNQTLEHIINFDKAVSEIKRICKEKVIISVPCQKYYLYTFDLHINFFPIESYLINSLKFERYECIKFSGTWVFIGYI